MAKKKIELFVDINNEHQFHTFLKKNPNKLICVEIFCPYFGFCTALDRLFTTIKLDWTSGKIILLRVDCEEVEALKRFRNHSEPFYMFILNNRVTNIYKGVDFIQIGEVTKREWDYYSKFLSGEDMNRVTYEIDEPTPEEKEWYQIQKEENQLEISRVVARRAQRQATRKQFRAELMVPHLEHLNFVLYWPHCRHAHPELYERWDINNIVMVGREEVEMTKEKAEDILYNGDAPINEASMHFLLSGPALAICFRLLDTDKHFVSLVRRILYEDLPDFDESKPLNEQPPRLTAYNHYKTYSLTKEEIWKRRKEERHKKKEEIRERRARRLSEMQRLARQEIEEALNQKKRDREEMELNLLRAGKLDELEALKQTPLTDSVDITIPEAIEESAEEDSEEEDENEYFPPPGLVIPGFYAPPNDIAKVNGLALLFRKLVEEHVMPEDEFLPEHVLVMISIEKRHKAINLLTNYKKYVLQLGVFKATCPYDAVKVADSVIEYDAMDSPYPNEELVLALMISTERDIALVELMELYPVYVSRDEKTGEEDCAAIFPHCIGHRLLDFEDGD